MAPERWALTDRLHRLGRLLRAQGQIGKAIEARLAHQEWKIADLRATRIEICRLAESAAAANPALLPALLRRLSSVELHLIQIEGEAEALRHELLSATGREKIISARVKSMREAGERKLTEEQMLETALAMAAKASRKPGMVS